MTFERPTILDILALIVASVSTALQYLSFFYPSWWSYTYTSSAGNVRSKVVGMFQSEECSASRCETKSLVNIEGDYGKYLDGLGKAVFYVWTTCLSKT